jgi:hypothetical protein
VNITFRNTGQCTWTAGGGYKLGSQSPPDNASWGTGRVLLDAGDSIAPGQSKTFTLNATAPAAAGEYAFEWRMVRDGVAWFGPATPSVTVIVTECCYPDGWSYEGNDGSFAGFEATPAVAGAVAGSPSGCDTQIVTKTARSVLFRSVLFRFHLRVYWCWDYPRITQLGVSCYATDVDTVTIIASECTNSGNYYTWRRHPRGGRYELAQATFANCVFIYGCWRRDLNSLEIWINGNGAWTKRTS